MNYGKQSINEADIRAVESVLRSTHLTCGSKITEFEEALATYTGAKYAVVVSNGTAALHLLALALRPPIVSVPDITFMATANAWIHAGSKVKLVDVAGDQPMLLDTTYDELVVPVHMAGFPVNLTFMKAPIIIEDACHALGASWRNSVNNKLHKVGDCSHSKATVFSFHPVKPITTGEGGAITTNDEALATELRQLRSHGIKDSNYTLHKLGLNYRMTDFQAALGISQLSRLDQFIERRRDIAHKYDDAFMDLGIVGIKELSHQQSGYHLYTLRIKDHHRDQFRLNLSHHGINTQIHYKPIHTIHKEQEGSPFPNANKWYATTVSIPCYPDLTNDEVRDIINVVGNEVPPKNDTQ